MTNAEQNSEWERKVDDMTKPCRCGGLMDWIKPDPEHEPFYWCPDCDHKELADD